jgi:hypothetical protein
MIIQAEILQYCCTLFGFWELSNKKKSCTFEPYNIKTICQR